MKQHKTAILLAIKRKKRQLHAGSKMIKKHFVMLTNGKLFLIAYIIQRTPIRIG
jgi:hypothetical protein